MDDSDQLPPEIQRIAKALDQAAPEVRDLFFYAVTLMLIDDERAKVIATRSESGIDYLKIETVTGETFEIRRPAVSKELLATLREQAWEILQEDKGE